jgi:hypothetical protein
VDCADPDFGKSSRKAPSLRFWHKPSANLKTSDDRLKKDDRVSKAAEELELMIKEAVQAAPGCEAFMGVVVQRITPKSRLDANWELRRTKFGRADRKITRLALTPIVERMQRLLLSQSHRVRLLRGRPEGIFINPFEQGKIAPPLPQGVRVRTSGPGLKASRPALSERHVDRARASMARTGMR